jgi:hypothetical protein
MDKYLKNKIKFIIKAYNKSFVWKKPNKLEEKEEFYSYPEKYFNKFEEGKLIELKEEIWNKMKNTDSYKIKNLQEAKNMSNFYKRDIDSILQATSLPAPIVVKDTKGQYILVAGNTRLMVSRALKVTPKIWLIDLNN